MRLHVPASGVATASFGVSPLFELGALTRRLRLGARGALNPKHWMRWRTSYDALAGDPNVRLVAELNAARHGSLIWVSGVPTMGRTIADDLAAVDALTDERLVAETRAFAGDHAPTEPEIRAMITTGIRRLWDALLAPSWLDVFSVAEHEVARLGTRLRTNGWSAVFDDLCEDLAWDGESLEFGGLSASDVAVHDRSRLVLVPSVFALSGPIVLIGDQGGPTVIFFPARGIGNLVPGPLPDHRDALGALMGPNRARVLATLADPVTVSRLHTLLQLPLGSLSRHLRVLVDAGLARSHRVGRSVEYQLTELGRALVTARPNDPAPSHRRPGASDPANGPRPRSPRRPPQRQ